MSGFRQVFFLSCTMMFIGGGAAKAASPAAVEFSADTYQTGPDQTERVGHIYVGKNRIRSEMEQHGQQVVNIIDSEKQVTWVLYPQQQSYIEYPMGGAEGAATLKGSPCEGIPGAQCKKLGDDKIQGRSATKWDVLVKGQGGSMRSTQWIGKQRSILLRQEIQGGPIMEQRMLAVEELNGRQVEKWEMTVSQNNQSPQSSARWFDPELNLAIKEVNAAGYVRELKNIAIGIQHPVLFTIPDYFKKIVPQPQPAR